MEAAYALMHVYPKAHIDALQGMAISIPDIRKVGQNRLNVQNALASALKTGITWETPLFVLPYFSKNSERALQRAGYDLLEKGIHTTLAAVDVARDMYNPVYKQALLLPCHQEVTEKQVETISSVIKSAGA